MIVDEPQSTCDFVGGPLDGKIDLVHDHADFYSVPVAKLGVRFINFRYRRTADNPLVFVPDDDEETWQPPANR